MTKLATLRDRLGTLRRRRATVRLGNAYSVFAIALIWILAGDFIVDVTLEMSRLQRFVALLAIGGAAYWVFRKFTVPHLGQRETELDMALLVEKQQEIDSDLVAALQFEQPEARRWGSGQLEGAVIDYVAAFGNGLNVFQGFSQRELVRRFSTLAVTLAVLFVAGAVFPGYALAFFNRLLLGSRHYPTRTVIEQIVINGQELEPYSQTTVRSAFGRPLRFEIHCAGELPEAGQAKLQTVRSGLETALDLKPLSAGAASGKSVYVGELPRLVDSVSYQLFLGDAWTDPAELQVIPLPVVNIELTPISPSYAHHAEATTDEQLGTRQISVIEGSRVDLRVLGVNKPLQSVGLVIEGKDYPLTAQGEDGLTWSLTSTDTPFHRVLQPIQYQVRVVDRDGLELEQPIQGLIRLKVDRGPRVFAAIISRKVVPNAQPRVSFGAGDDYGVSKVRVVRQLDRADGSTEKFAEDIKTVLPSEQPRTQLRGQYKLDLKPLKLAKGDQLTVTLEAFDYRGESEPKSALSEPLVLQVTDVQGILASMVESDEQSAKRLDAIIQRQLGIGETK